jgi:hypothetical protein
MYPVLPALNSLAQSSVCLINEFSMIDAKKLDLVVFRLRDVHCNDDPSEKLLWRSRTVAHCLPPPDVRRPSVCAMLYLKFVALARRFNVFNSRVNAPQERAISPVSVVDPSFDSNTEQIDACLGKHGTRMVRLRLRGFPILNRGITIVLEICPHAQRHSHKLQLNINQ